MKDLNEHKDYVQRMINYYFNNEDLLFQAFTRRSYTEENGTEHNEVLEFIGDRVLDFYVTKILIDRYGYTKSQLEDYDDENSYDEFVVEKYSTEGNLTDIKKKLVNKKMLAQRIEKLGLKEYLIMGNGDIKQNKQNEDSVKEDLFEAILGAIAIDSNWNPDELEDSVNFMLNMDHYLNNGFTEDKDFVGLIQQWNQKENGEIPEYQFLEYRDGSFNAILDLDTQRGMIRYQAEGYSKSEARMNVSEIAYRDLADNDELFTMKDELPENLTVENSINTLQELAQKGYISMPEYFIPEEQTYDKDGNSYWSCNCIVKSYSLSKTAYASSKKEAKKYVAYLCIIYIFGMPDEYSN